LDLEPHELCDDPREELPEEDAAWQWDLVDSEENGPTRNPPNRRGRWKRWYFIYHEPTCSNIKISADRDPNTGRWFNPHRSSGQP
jgi:hypothetical protein